VDEPYAQISGVLPICLHLDERIFTIQIGEKTVEITTHNVSSEEPTWVGTAKNMEVDLDDFSHFRFTGITTKIPHDKPNVGPHEVLDAYRDVFFEALNLFVACCRVALERSGLKSYYDYGQFVRPVIATIAGPSNPKQSTVAAFNFGGGPLTSFRPNRSEDEHQRLQSLLTQGIPLTTAFMMDARNYLYYRDSIHALLSAVIALEVAVSGAIRKLALKKGIGADDVKAFIHDVGLSGNIKTTLRLLAPDETQLPADKIFGGCKGAIRVRNAIMHEGRRLVDVSEVKGWVGEIEAMITFCESLG